MPFISDSAEQIEEMVKTAKEFGADYVFVGALTLSGIGKNFTIKFLRNIFQSYCQDISTFSESSTNQIKHIS
ncbi:hypothetical protein CW706_05775 [Candidatus Bathyarchaeota archaeon]|nr:MAG: hypothetical protein CW706_05775 [Candidatus Bathyarchaeota archaeon]